jgi:predicted amidophosphoribosyltransferase
VSGWIRTVPGPVRLIHLLAGDLLDLFFPAPCLACGNPGVSGPICSSCRRTLERRRTSSAVRAIEGLPVVTPFEYAFPLNRLIPRAKRRGWPRHLAVLVAPMISALRTAGLSDWPQVVAPVPLHPTRRRERGWDQAVYLAGKVAECLELPCSPAALRRSRATPPQKSAGRDERRAALEGAFDR